MRRPPGARPSLALLVALAACGGAPTPAPKASPAPPPPAPRSSLEGVAAMTITRGPAPEVLARAVRAFELAGHRCQFDRDGDALCDEKDDSSPTLVLSTAESDDKLAVSIASLLTPLPQGLACAGLDAFMTSARALVSDLHIECRDERIVVGGFIEIPVAGITVREFNSSSRTLVAMTSLVFLHLSHLAAGARRSTPGVAP